MAEAEKSKGEKIKEFVRSLSGDRRRDKSGDRAADPQGAAAMDPVPGPSRVEDDAEEERIGSVSDEEDEIGSGSLVSSRQPGSDFNSDYAFMTGNPLGAVLLNMFEDQQKLLEKAEKREASANIKELCCSFRSFTKEQAADEGKLVELAAAKVEEMTLQKELHSHKLNQQYKLPGYFAPSNTLNSVVSRNAAYRAFPTKEKFSGLKEGPGVLEFLSQLTMAQTSVKCSQEEFSEMMLSSTTGRAHCLLNDWLANLGEDVGIIYNQFLLYFDKRMTPQDARRLLLVFKAPKSGNLAETIEKISDLAGRVASEIPNGPSRTHVFNLEAVNGLIRSLPPTSSNQVSNVYHQLNAKLGGAATIGQLTLALNMYRGSIDADIKSHGWTSGDKGYNSKYRGGKAGQSRGGGQGGNHPKVHNVVASTPTASGQVNAVANTTPPKGQQGGKGQGQQNQQPAPQASNQTGYQNYNSGWRGGGRGRGHRGGYHNGRGRGGYQNYHNNDGRKPFCSLCGKGHNTKYCDNMLDDNGSMLRILPVQATCNLCPQTQQPRLHHPPFLCPYRPQGVFTQTGLNQDVAPECAPSLVIPHCNSSSKVVEGNTLKDRLQRLAGYSEFSDCVSYKLKISEVSSDFQENAFIDENIIVPPPPISPKVYELNDDIFIRVSDDGKIEFESGYSQIKVEENRKKIYIPIFINGFRTIALVDQGSDISMINFSLYKGLRRKIPGGLRRSTVKTLTSFSGDQTSVIGEVLWETKLIKNGPSFTFRFLVIHDCPNLIPLLLGEDFLKLTSGILSYSHSIPPSPPQLIIRNPMELICEVLYTEPHRTLECYAEIEINGFSEEVVTFTLNKAAQVLRSDYILITSLSDDELIISPSYCDLTFDENSQCFQADALVINTGEQNLKRKLVGKFEIVTNCDLVPLTRENSEKLKKVYSSCPLGREVLICSADSPNQFISQISTEQCNQAKILQISERESAEAIFEKSPSYDGEASLSDEVLETNCGLEIPTQIFSSAKEAIQLEKFPIEIREHISRLFLEKYPQCVSLHSLDSGNISATLGYVKLRLKPGERLPRSKRIFHLSSSDERHLNDICEFLVDCGYLRISPSEPNNLHLFGMPCYLVPRAKGNSLGRLVIDYSPVNSLFQSPANVIPQFLAGKGMYTVVDLRYAFLCLGLSEDKQIRLLISKIQTYLSDKMHLKAAKSEKNWILLSKVPKIQVI